MKGYKGFDKDLKCRDMQYEVGKTYEENEAKLCKKGLHFCEEPFDVLTYYGFMENVKSSRFCEVEADEVSDETSNDDTKRVAKKLTIGAEIGIPGLVKAQIEYVKAKVTESVEKGESEAATAGNYGAATAGYKGAATAGNYGAATSRGCSSSGENGLSVARGNNVKVKGGIGAVIVIVEEDEDSYDIKEWKSAVVDGENIKPDTWFRLIDGKFTEVTDDD